MRTVLVALTMLLAAGAVLAEPVTLTGMVVGPDGQPVAGARVLTVQMPKQGDPAPVETITDQAGAFSILTDIAGWNFTPGQYQPQAALPLLARKQGFSCGIGRTIPGLPVTLTLGEQTSARGGVVEDAEGKPLAGVSVVVSYLTAPATGRAAGGGENVMFWSGSTDAIKAVTDTEGRFAFEGIPPAMGLSGKASRDGYAKASWQIPDDKPITLKLQPEAVVSGKVTAQGQPAAGVVVWASNPESGTGSRVNTAADGSYALRGLAAGETTVVIPASQSYVEAPRQTVTLAVGQKLTGMDFSLVAGACIRGRVIDAADGGPAVGASVLASAIPGPNEAMAQTDEDGKYQARVPAGKYQLSCYGRGVEIKPPAPPGTSPDAPEVLTVSEGEVVEKDFTIKGPRKVLGQVSLAEGQRADEVEVRGYGRSYWAERFVVGEDGRFQVAVPEPTAGGPPGSPPPDLTMIMVARDRARNLYAISKVTDGAEQVAMRLQPGASAVVPVVDQQGRPLADIPVMALVALDDRMGSFTIAETTTDKAGLAQINALPTGLKLQFRVEWSMSHLVIEEATPETQEYSLRTREELKLPPIVMEPKGRSLNVFVGDAEGRAVAGARVQAQHAENIVTTDDQGKVTLTGLQMQGRARILAVHPNGELFAGATADPDKGPWPGLLLKPLGTATGLVIAKEGGKPLAGANLRCQPEGNGWWWMDPRLSERLGMRDPNGRRCEADAVGRWEFERLIPGAEYELILTIKTDEGDESGRWIGSFVAEGGTELQDVGVVEVGAREE